MIIAFPHPPGGGGPGSFQTRFEKALRSEGAEIAYAGSNIRPDVVFVVGGTKRIIWLLRLKWKGVPIIHRLDGLAWLHRRKGWITFLYGEWGNFLFKFIHSFIATHVVYQSKFVNHWWDRSGWRKPKNYSIIYNGVDLEELKPCSTPGSPIDLLCVEGTLDYSPYAIDLLNYLQSELIEKSDYRKLILYGGFQNPANERKLHPQIDYRGRVSRSKLPGIYKNAVYLSLDVNAACPNTVVEAMACGLPVVGYDTGALRELAGNAGEVVEYGGDPWRRKMPDFRRLKKRLLSAWIEYEDISKRNLERARGSLNMPNMVNEYLTVIKLVTKN